MGTKEQQRGDISYLRYNYNIKHESCTELWPVIGPRHLDFPTVALWF